VVHKRLNRDDDALRELGEAKARAEAASPPNYRELAKIGREMAAVYAGQGDAKRAADALVTALAFASLEGDADEAVRIVAAIGCIEADAQRFDSVARLYRSLVSHGALSTLPPREARRVRVDLCQALNRLGAYDEALQHVASVQAELPEDEKRLRFLTRLEEARAFGGRGQFDVAEQVLHEAEKLLPAKDSAFERSEFIQALAELQEAKGGPSAVKSLEHLIGTYAGQGSAVHEVVARRALANALLRLGEKDRAREALAQALRKALQHNLVGVADEIRAQMLKGAGAEHLEALAESIDLIGSSAVERRFIRLERLSKDGAESLAIDLTDGARVALKKIDLSGLSEAERQAVMNTVKTEYAGAGQLNDPRVARVVDLRMAPGGVLCVVQRDVPGPTLRELYATGARSERLLELLAGIADALAVLHGKGIVHRDLKPENVVVAHDARGLEWPVLIDLGIALVIGHEDKIKHFGTPPYVAPEQVAGRPVDGRADIYALGQMIAEIWGGKLSPRFSLGMLRRGNEAAPMPRAIGEMVRGMLSQNPDDRTGDLAGIAQTLRTQCQQIVQG